MADNSWWNTLSTGFSNFADGVGDFFNVGSTVSPSSNIKADDVLKTKSALNAVGSYKVPDFGITDIPDQGMIDGLKNFQANNGLKVDGIMKPGGPTEAALGQTLSNQGISTAGLLEKAKAPSITLPKPISPPPQTSWSAAAPIGDISQPTKPKLSKIDPMTGLTDPLANAPKGKMPTEKQWEEVAKTQQQKASNAIIPQGDTVDQRIRSMMTDTRYGDQHDTRLRDHVQKQFENAYPGKVEYDETGKMVPPTAAIQPQDVQPFDPDGDLQNVSTETFKSEPIIMERVTSETRPVIAASMVEQESDEKTPQGHSYTKEMPTINNGDKRIENILNDENAHFDIKDNPNASAESPWYESIDAGKTAIASYGKIIEAEARRQGVDPDLVKAIVFAENARGHYFGAARAAEGVGMSKTILPMNIDPKIWGKLGIDEKSAFDPQTNVRAGVTLIKRIAARLDDPTPAKIASIWNFTGRENTNDFGAYVDRMYKEKKWE